MRDVLTPVLLNDVVDDLLTPVVLEVHVNVGHFLAFEVEETLEYEPVRERVHVGNAQTVEGKACGGASTHREEDVVLANEPGDVPHDQEVVVEASLSYDFEFVLEPLLLFLSGVGDPAFQAVPAQVGQVLEWRDALGDVVLGQSQLLEINVEVAHFGDLLGVGDRFGQVLE